LGLLDREIRGANANDIKGIVNAIY